MIVVGVIRGWRFHSGSSLWEPPWGEPLKLISAIYTSSPSRMGLSGGSWLPCAAAACSLISAGTWAGQSPSTGAGFAAGSPAGSTSSRRSVGVASDRSSKDSPPNGQDQHAEYYSDSLAGALSMNQAEWHLSPERDASVACLRIPIKGTTRPGAVLERLRVERRARRW